MVMLPYFGPMVKVKFQLSLSVSTQFDFYQHQSGEHVDMLIFEEKLVKQV